MGALAKLSDSLLRSEQGTRRYLRSYHGSFLSIDASNNRVVTTQQPSVWRCLRNNDGTWSLCTPSGQYLSARPDGVSLAPHNREWEQWHMEDLTDAAAGRVAFRSHHGTYMCAFHDGGTRLQPHLREWEWWSLVCEAEVDDEWQMCEAEVDDVLLSA